MEEIHKAWELLGPAHNFLYSIILSLATALIFWLFKPRVKIIWGRTSVNYHNFNIDEDSPVHVSTQKFFVQNVGKKGANTIEIFFSSPPTSYNIWPPREHRTSLVIGDHFSISVPFLAPGELIIVDTVDIDTSNPNILSVNCADVVSKQVEFVAQRQFGKLFNSFAIYLFFAGVVGTIYAIISLVF
ncbi:hypothetical protein [Neogemmobacter tilapiae]|uniref:hypothetical protein n=1 Tax=Neogemmobacter tilapiae TaxID=875041 RepID=UPI001E284791|nr:hypothetical protein [Gemmobacter tilapiae]